MILATEKLKNFATKGIENLLDENAIKGASIDLRINELVKVQQENTLDIDLLDIDLETTIDNKLYYETSLAGKDFWLKPNEYLYGSTYEKINIPSNMCGILLPRSTFARLGLILPVSQYANPGYKGSLPIVIYNASKNNIKIPPYYRVMQMLLCEINGDAIKYEEQKDSKYQHEQAPSNPRSHKDIDISKIIDLNQSI